MNDPPQGMRRQMEDMRPSAAGLGNQTDSGAIADRLLAAVCAGGFVLSGDGRVRDMDVPALLAMSSRAARELREAGCSWPRYQLPIAGCRFSVYVAELAQWCAGRPRDAS